MDILIMIQNKIQGVSRAISYFQYVTFWIYVQLPDRPFIQCFIFQCHLFANQSSDHSLWFFEMVLNFFHRGTSSYLLYFSLLRSEEHTSELQSRFDLVCR